MSKRALITGGTDGFGAALAVKLAQQGYQIDIVGRSQERADAVLAQVNQAAPNGEHRFFQIDLASIDANKTFLADYQRQRQQLDLLVLNALPHGSKTELSEDGLNTIFAVGCVSRYLFCQALEPLLNAGQQAQVIHIADASLIDNINYDAIEGKQRLGVGKASYQAFAGSSLLAYHLNKLGFSKIPHQLYHPGPVKTKQTERQGLLMSLMSLLVKWQSPADAAQTLVNHIKQTPVAEVAGRIYKQGEKQKAGADLLIGEAAFGGLTEFLSKHTKVTLEQVTLEKVTPEQGGAD